MRILLIFIGFIISSPVFSQKSMVHKVTNIEKEGRGDYKLELETNYKSEGEKWGSSTVYKTIKRKDLKEYLLNKYDYRIKDYKSIIDYCIETPDKNFNLRLAIIYPCQ